MILDILENLLKPEVNALLHEFGFQVWWYFILVYEEMVSLGLMHFRDLEFFPLQLLYELCVDPLTSGPTMDLLSNKRYHFFLKVQDDTYVR